MQKTKYFGHPVRTQSRKAAAFLQKNAAATSNRTV